jgi:hypothetical protein
LAVGLLAVGLLAVGLLAVGLLAVGIVGCWHCFIGLLASCSQSKRGQGGRAVATVALARVGPARVLGLQVLCSPLPPCLLAHSVHCCRHAAVYTLGSHFACQQVARWASSMHCGCCCCCARVLPARQLQQSSDCASVTFEQCVLSGTPAAVCLLPALAALFALQLPTQFGFGLFKGLMSHICQLNAVVIFDTTACVSRSLESSLQALRLVPCALCCAVLCCAVPWHLPTKLLVAWELATLQGQGSSH